MLQCTIRNRQKLSYGQRCTPVSVDDYNLDNISEYNRSIRRKGAVRASKRSYGNPAFDDPVSWSGRNVGMWSLMYLEYCVDLCF